MNKRKIVSGALIPFKLFGEMIAIMTAQLLLMLLAVLPFVTVVYVVSTVSPTVGTRAIITAVPVGMLLALFALLSFY